MSIRGIALMSGPSQRYDPSLYLPQLARAERHDCQVQKPGWRFSGWGHYAR
jgi:hypothetical protein